MIAVDASAIVAILQREAGYEGLVEALKRADRRRRLFARTDIASATPVQNPDL